MCIRQEKRLISKIQSSENDDFVENNMCPQNGDSAEELWYKLLLPLIYCRYNHNTNYLLVAKNLN